MNRTLLFALIGALGTALVVAMLISGLSGKKSQAPVPQILVAAKDIPIGATLDGNNARWQEWSSASAVPGALKRDTVKDEDWKNQKIRRALTSGEPITQGALVREINGSYLAAALEPGMRAVAIETDASSGVAGFLAPGDRVDVILVMAVQLRADNNAALEEYVLNRASETILSNVRVLATDQDAAGNTGGDRKAKVSKTITLEVDKKGAETLALAKESGEITLALRQLGEKDKTSITNTITTDVQALGMLHESVKRKQGGDRPKAVIRVYTPDGAQLTPVVTMPSDGGR